MHRPLSFVIDSPAKTIAARVGPGPDGRLQLGISKGGRTIFEASAIGVTVEGTDLGRSIVQGQPKTDSVDENYPARGWHTTATNRCTVFRLPMVHETSGISWTLEVKVFEDGVAYRYVIPGNGPRLIGGEDSSWKLPEGAQVWIAERNSDWKLKSYAGWWMRVDAGALPSVSSQGPVQAPPLVLELPNGGYAALSEAALTNYSGMRLRAIGRRTLQADFTEGESGFTVAGEIITPWRVTLLCPDLNSLVNSDLLTNLNPPPDPALFPDLSYIKPGRATWRWWSQGTGNPEQERRYVDFAQELGFEHSLIDDGWEAWPEKWEQLASICRYAKERGIGVFVWKDYKDVPDPAGSYAQLRSFLDAIKQAGASGVKIDFMNAESKDRIDFQMAALRETALRRLMLLFHGCQKPTGESRTWPHEVSREGIRGLELNKMSEGPITAAHNAALPFTRYVAGQADYTPVGYSNPGDTTWAHQLATAIIFTSPLNVIAENPEALLHDPATAPALDVLKQIPSCWDETRVLPPSAIGRAAVFARRQGTKWFVGAINGTDESMRFPLDLSFLGDTRCRATILTSPTPHSFARNEMAGINAASRLEISLGRVDGWVGLFALGA